MPNKVIITYITENQVREIRQDNSLSIDAVKAIAQVKEVDIVYQQRDEPLIDIKRITITLPEDLDLRSNFAKYRNIAWRSALITLRTDQKLGYQLPPHYTVYFIVGMITTSVNFLTPLLAQSDLYCATVKNFIDLSLTKQDDKLPALMLNDYSIQYNIKKAKQFLKFDYRIIALETLEAHGVKSISCYVLSGNAKKFNLLIIMLDVESILIDVIIHQKKVAYPEL